MNDGLPSYRGSVYPTVLPVPPRGPIHDDSALLYADPAEMDDYLAALEASGSLRCAHEVPRHLDCADCTVDSQR